jgi:hypothetical protein
VVDDAPFFALVDSCRVLGIENHANVATRLRGEEREAAADADTPDVGVHTTDTLPVGVIQLKTPTRTGDQLITFISESNLYSVILLSRKWAARKFKLKAVNAELPGPRYFPNGRNSRTARRSRRASTRRGRIRGTACVAARGGPRPLRRGQGRRGTSSEPGAGAVRARLATRLLDGDAAVTAGPEDRSVHGRRAVDDGIVELSSQGPASRHIRLSYRPASAWSGAKCGPLPDPTTGLKWLAEETLGIVLLGRLV